MYIAGLEAVRVPANRTGLGVVDAVCRCSRLNFTSDVQVERSFRHPVTMLVWRSIKETTSDTILDVMESSPRCC